MEIIIIQSLKDVALIVAAPKMATLRFLPWLAHQTITDRYLPESIKTIHDTVSRIVLVPAATCPFQSLLYINHDTLWSYYTYWDIFLDLLWMLMLMMVFF